MQLLFSGCSLALCSRAIAHDAISSGEHPEGEERQGGAKADGVVREKIAYRAPARELTAVRSFTLAPFARLVKSQQQLVGEATEKSTNKMSGGRLLALFPSSRDVMRRQRGPVQHQTEAQPCASHAPSCGTLGWRPCCSLIDAKTFFFSENDEDKWCPDSIRERINREALKRSSQRSRSGGVGGALSEAQRGSCG